MQKNTFEELLKLGAIPIVNENDTISTYEIEFGDNDTLSAVVASLISADLLILLSDIDGLFTDDPRRNKQAHFIDVVESIDSHLMEMGKGTTGSTAGTGGMAAKLTAANLATSAGADMIIANGEDFRDSPYSQRKTVRNAVSSKSQRGVLSRSIISRNCCSINMKGD